MALLLDGKGQEIMIEWDLSQSWFKRAWIGFWPDFISGRFVSFLFRPGDERFLFDRTTLKTIFYYTPETASTISKPALDYPEDFLLVRLRLYWRTRRPCQSTLIFIFHLYPLRYLPLARLWLWPLQRDIFWFDFISLLSIFAYFFILFSGSLAYVLSWVSWDISFCWIFCWVVVSFLVS